MVKDIWNMDMDDFIGGSSGKTKRKAVSKTVQNEVMFQQDYECYQCGEKLPARKHFHHIKPVSEGGDNSLNNIVAVCSNCHNDAHHKIQLEKQEKKSSGGKTKSIWDMELEDIWGRKKYGKKKRIW